MKKRALLAATAAAAAFVMPIAGGSMAPASAAGQDGVVNSNEFVLYYNTDCVNSRSDFASKVDNFLLYEFLTNGAGKGEPVKNNAACAYNTKSVAAIVYVNSNQMGVSQTIPGNTKRNLNSNLKNNNASFWWAS